MWWSNSESECRSDCWCLFGNCNKGWWIASEIQHLGSTSTSHRVSSDCSPVNHTYFLCNLRADLQKHIDVNIFKRLNRVQTHWNWYKSTKIKTLNWHTKVYNCVLDTIAQLDRTLPLWIKSWRLSMWYGATMIQNRFVSPKVENCSGNSHKDSCPLSYIIVFTEAAMITWSCKQHLGELGEAEFGKVRDPRGRYPLTRLVPLTPWMLHAVKLYKVSITKWNRSARWVWALPANIANLPI
jgi:hypothetical protein